MLPYQDYLDLLALKNITRSPHIPNFHLGIYPYEILTNIVNRGVARTMPEIPQKVVYSDAAIKGQTYEGLPGFGSIIPNISPEENPYYGEYVGSY